MIQQTLRTIFVLGLLFIADACRAASVTARLDSVTSAGTINQMNLGDGANPSITYPYAGFVNWTQVPSVNNSSLLHQFSTFCIELGQDVFFNGTYTFQIQALEISPNPGTLATGAPTGMGAAKAQAIRRLWNGFHGLIASSDGAAAFQTAIWRIEYDLGSGTLTNFNTGNFRVSGPSQILNLATSLLNYTTSSTNVSATVGGIAFGDFSTQNMNVYALTNADVQDQITEFLSPPGNDAPEPSSLMLGLIGGLVLTGVGYRRRNKGLKIS